MKDSERPETATKRPPTAQNLSPIACLHSESKKIYVVIFISQKVCRCVAVALHAMQHGVVTLT